MEKYIDPKALEDGVILFQLKNKFLKNRCKETLFPVLGCLRDSNVIVPMNVLMSKEDENMFRNAKPGDKVSTYNDIRFKPDILKNGDKYFFPIFSNEEQIPKEYGSKFSMIKLPVVQCIQMAKTYQHVSGLVLDAFTEDMILENELADIILKIDSNVAPDEKEGDSVKEINTWPGWECVRQLGAGAFGKVYEIQRIENGKVYKSALKVISVPQNEADIENAYSEGMDKENVTKYFKSFVNDITNEVALMSDLKGYTNIVSYEDHMVLEHENGIGWDILIRMELLIPLHKWIAEHPLSENDVIRLGCDICRALELCHKNKIIHRDIKPENIFVNKNGDFKLGDFGIARVAEKTSSVMSSQKGTYTYMAPEVFEGRHYNETVDIYSLGIVLYRFLNKNRTPFLPMGALQHTDRQTALEKRMAGEAIPAPANGSEKLKQAVLMALHYDPNKRFQSATVFRNVLEQCQVDSDNPIPPVEPDAPPVKPVVPPIPKPEDDSTFRGRVTENPVEDIDDPTVRGKGNIPIPASTKNNKWILPVTIISIALLVVVIAASALKPTPNGNGSTIEDTTISSTTQNNTTDILGDKDEDNFTASQKEENNEENSNEQMEITGELQLVCTTDILLVGDTVRLAVGTESFLFDNSTEGLQFYSSNTNVATVDSQGIVKGKSSGTVNLTAVYEDKEAICQLYIAEEQPTGRNVIIDTDYERISVDYYEDVTVDLTLYGDVPENFGMSRYCSGNMLMSFEWGELNENLLPLTICALQGDGNEGKVTVLLYSKDNPQNVVSSTSFTVKVN